MGVERARIGGKCLAQVLADRPDVALMQLRAASTDSEVLGTPNLHHDLEAIFGAPRLYVFEKGRGRSCRLQSGIAQPEDLSQALRAGGAASERSGPCKKHAIQTTVQAVRPTPHTSC